MNNLCIDIGYQSLNKYGEELCGDHIELVKPNDDSVVMVLADGLGSGVKASILSTLTSKIISTMMAQSMNLEECVLTIAETLPVCEVRKVAYSTFSIIRIIDTKEVEIIQYDNPHVILLRNGKSIPLHETAMEIEGKTIYRSRIRICEDDAFVAMSDGAVHAGVGKSLNYSWQRSDIIAFMEKIYNREFSAKTLTTLLLDKCNRLYGSKPGDDTTVCVIKIRKRKPVNLLIGPPTSTIDDSKMMSLFFAKEGKHIICGGTTSELAAKFLHKSIDQSFGCLDPEIPPTAKIEGVDLVTEGVITINKVLFYAQNYLENNDCYCEWKYKKDGASLISQLLFEEATDINFYVGQAVNPAHQDSALPFGFAIKMRLVKELSECLLKMGKKIKVSYF